MKYSAFISYRHGGLDEYVAKNLQKMMENYHIPGPIAEKLKQKKIKRIFRDVDELPTSGSLYENIEEALRDTEYLILICTPRLKESKWCMRELELFIQLRGADHVLAVLAEGEPQDSFPEALLYREQNGVRVEVEPLAADVRSTSLRGTKQKMKVEQLRLLAALLGCDFDQLRQRSRRRQMQQRMAAAGVAFAVVLAFLGMMTRENMKLQTEVSRTQRAQSYLLSQYSGNQYQSDDRTTAALLALEGLPEDLGNSRPFVSASLSALTNALQIYDYQQGYVADRSVTTRTLDTACLSADGNWMAYTDLLDSSTYFTHLYRLDEEKSKGDFPTNQDYCPYGSSKAKAVFYGDNRCVLAGLDGVQVIDLDSMQVLWTGAVANAVEISKDENVIAASDYRNSIVNFYTTDGTLLSTAALDPEQTVIPYGLNEDGTLFAVNIRLEDEHDQLLLLDTKTGEAAFSNLEATDNNAATYMSGWSDGILSYLYSDDTHNTCYAWYDSASNQWNVSDYSMENLLLYLDDEADLFYTNRGNQLEKVQRSTGEVLETYNAGTSITAAHYLEDGKWEIACTDGSLEYIDFTGTPYCISRSKGDGTGFTDIKFGGNYMIAFLINSYKVNLYQLNEKNAAKNADLLRSGEEECVYILRDGNLMCLNTTDNSYTVNLDTLQVQTYKSPISFLELPNETTVLLDEWKDNYTVFDAATGEKKAEIPLEGTRLAQGSFLVDTETHQLSQYDYDTGEITANYEVPETCVEAVYSSDKLVCDCVDGDKKTLEIYDSDHKLTFSAEVSFIDLSYDYVRYMPKDSTETVLYDLNQEKEIIRQDFGNVDWCLYTEDGGYIYVSTTDRGGYLVDRTTGSVVLALSSVSNLYNIMSWEGSEYFAILYIVQGGSTQLDVYLKDHPDSPIAQIEGGLALNANDEVLVYDGESKIYATPLESKETIYQTGLDFVGSQTLTDRQREEYHCE